MRHIKTLVAALMMGVSVASMAGTMCSVEPPTVESTKKAFDTALKVKQYVEQQPHTVYIIGRVGQNLTEYKQKYSHIAFLAKSSKGEWNIIHELNDCGTDHSGVYNEGLANFFMDDLYTFETVLIAPKAEDQEKLQAVLSNEKYLKQMHNPKYNMLAYPFSTKYQNSNQWVTEVSAFADVVKQCNNSEFCASKITRKDVQDKLKLEYNPGLLEIGAFKRLGGRIFRANIAFDDHDDANRYNGKIYTTTADSVIAYWKTKGAAIVEF